MHPTITQQPGESDHEARQRATEHAASLGRSLVFIVPLPAEKDERTNVDLVAALRKARELEQLAKSRRSLGEKTMKDGLHLPTERRLKYEARATRYFDEADAAAFEAAEIRRIVLRPR